MTLAVSDLIHPTAVIGPEVELAPDVTVGPYAILDGPVKVGPGCVIEGHACLCGPIEMGRDNFVGHGAVLGKSPQSRAYHGEQTGLVIGDGNTFREYVTVHRGTSEGRRPDPRRRPQSADDRLAPGPRRARSATAARSSTAPWSPVTSSSATAASSRATPPCSSGFGSAGWP